MCSHCKSQTTVTACTIFDKTRTELRVWFAGIWYITNQKHGISALGLQRVLGLGSYETAWTMLHRLRRAMVRPGRDLLHGKVEVDESYLSITDRKNPISPVGRKSDTSKVLVAIAVEMLQPKGFGRIRIRQIREGDYENLMPFIRSAELRLAEAQRARKAKRVQAIHAQIANRRKDFLHKLSTSIVCKYGAVFIGNVNASGLARTTMAKSVLDAGWSAFRTMLIYKSDNAGVWFKEVNESFTTQECSSCHARSGPKGRDELDLRSWTCSICDTVHDMDTNAAINIENRGLEWMAREISAAALHVQGMAASVNKDSGAFSTMAEAGYGLPVVGPPSLLPKQRPKVEVGNDVKGNPV
jgi:IS605 OrfB family transposase